MWAASEDFITLRGSLPEAKLKGRRGARTLACRVETLLDARADRAKICRYRHECRYGPQACVRHTSVQMQKAPAFRRGLKSKISNQTIMRFADREPRTIRASRFPPESHGTASSRPIAAHRFALFHYHAESHANRVRGPDAVIMIRQPIKLNQTNREVAASVNIHAASESHEETCFAHADVCA